jgi:hypothetical protein
MHKFGLRERRFSYTPAPVYVMESPAPAYMVDVPVLRDEIAPMQVPAVA